MKKLGLTILLTVSIGFSYAQSWKKLNSMPTRLTFPVVGVIDGHIHVVGGGGTSGATDLHLRYAPETDKWDTLAPVPYLAQQPGGGVINGKLHYLGGGYPNSGTRLDDHYVYDPKLDSWTKLTKLPIKRVIHKTAVLGDSIYVLSGQPDKKRVDVYNAVTDTWTQYNDLPDNNFWYSGITTYKDKIYRFGGGGSIAATDAAHVYDPSTDSWSSLTSLPKSLHAPDATVLGDSIYITGGYSSARYLGGTWIYDIAKDSYAQGPYLNSARSYHNLVRVGECLYSIGGNNNSNPDSTAVSVLRFCRGDNFMSLPEQLSVPYGLQVFVTSEAVHIAGSEMFHQPINIAVVNSVGQLIHQSQQTPKAQNNLQIPINLLVATPGVYVCRVQQGASQTQVKFIVN